MVRGLLSRIAANVLVAGILASAAPMGADAQGPVELDALNRQMVEFHSQGKYKEAAAIAEKALALAESSLGPEHLDTLTWVNNLAALYNLLERLSEAESLYRRALQGRERALGAEHPDTLLCLNNLGFLLQGQGRYDEAEPLLRHALGVRERVLGPEHPDTLASVNNLASLNHDRGRLSEAERLYKRAQAGFERVLGVTHPSTLTAIGNLGFIYYVQGRFREAEPLYRRALAGAEAVLGREHPGTLKALNNLSELFVEKGRYREAEPLHLRALGAREHVLGPEHPDTLRSVGNLGALYLRQGRYDEAEPFFKRALTGSERVFGAAHPDTVRSVNNLAFLYAEQGRYEEAEPLYKRALADAERAHGPEHPNTLKAVNNLGEFYRTRGRLAEAEPLLQRGLAGNEHVLGADHPDTLISRNNLGILYEFLHRYAEAELLLKRNAVSYERALGVNHPNTLSSMSSLTGLYWSQGRDREAEPLLKRVLAGRERALGTEHPDTIRSASDLAALYFLRGDWPHTVEFWRRSTKAVVKRVQRATLAAGGAMLGKKKSETERESWQFLGLVKAVRRAAPGDRLPDQAAALETFQLAQWAQSSEAAASLAQMAARGAKGDPLLAALARERQDLTAEWQARDGLRNAALGQAPAQRNAKAEAENQARMQTIDARIVEIDRELTAKFPDYAALASPAPLPAEEVQALLRADEALLLFLATPEAKPTPEETFIWVVTKTEMRWIRSDLGTASLRREVQALRCGLDENAWAGPQCAELTGGSYSWADRNAGKQLPFDRARAFRLYRALFEQVDDLIKDKQLLLVPTGSLTQLPFQVLVPAPAVRGDNRAAAWLVRDHALTVLPAVSSLKALRQIGRPSLAKNPMIGFGNPLLDGPDERYARPAKLARDIQACASKERQVAEAFELRGGFARVKTRGGFADGAFLRMQVPLPETAEELCMVASQLNADPSDIRLGARATEREVKRLSESGELAQYRIVHFATHGALAGEVTGNSEPGLLLTPPDVPSEVDDGYLSASEIAGLKLDADWVILSACNTAAGGAEGAPSLSGLARAFIYAQARALLVSHWAVDSQATVKLITGALSRIAADKSLSRAEAMRQAMLGLIDGNNPIEAHPSHWAPFIVVGEGAAVR
jgi:CHAT domain-containing protein/tetratricopeptide (TPR) repeat protein